jgi:hypothetical protein
MTSIDGAVIKEQGVTFAVAIVRSSVLNSAPQRAESLEVFSGVFGGLPTLLMAQDSAGVPTYFGRNDLVKFLADLPMEAIPWSRYQVT